MFLQSLRHKSEVKLTKDTPYISPSWASYGAPILRVWENWPCYNGTALYIVSIAVCTKGDAPLALYGWKTAPVDLNFSVVISAHVWHLPIFTSGYQLNTLRPRQNGRHFADDIFKSIFLNQNVWIPIKISPKFVPNGLINNIPAFV